ncbi:MAG: hemerythrin domain-containing protein [Rhodospirillaceae bacterium]
MSRTHYPEALRRLAQDHIDIRLALNALEREVNSVAQYHEANSDVLGRGVQYFAHFPKSYHHPIEESLVTKLKLRAPEAAARGGGVAQHERIVEGIGELAMMMRNLFLDPPKWRLPFCASARSFITLKRDHMRDEETVVFRLALEHLAEEDWTEIDQASQKTHSAWMNHPARPVTGLLGLRNEGAVRASAAARRR